jgi:hypothetical protein
MTVLVAAALAEVSQLNTTPYFRLKMWRSLGALRRLPACSRPSSRGLGGGHGHSHVKQPYDAWHPPSHYGEVAYPFGIAPGTPKEGWEFPTLVTYVAVLGLFLYGSFVQGDNPSPLVLIICVFFRFFINA